MFVDILKNPRCTLIYSFAITKVVEWVIPPPVSSE